MQVLENLDIKEKVYTEKMPNGLTVMIIPKENTSKKYAIIGTHFGSIDNKFVIPGEEKETAIPDGVAHFLEHKMFEQESGINSLDTLSSLGVEANAYTSNEHTAYLFECTSNFDEAFKELMDYVQHPYFTDENVEKEKGIIAQEINMYLDDPGTRVYMEALKCMYKNNPVRIDIAGSVESIGKIDKEVLYNCYNTFYNPSNMALVLCGNFNIEETIQKVKENLMETKPIGKIKRIYPEEPNEIENEKSEINMGVSKPLFVIGIKEKPQENTDVKKVLTTEILLEILLGKSSELYKKLYEDGDLMLAPDLEYEFSQNYSHILITGQANNPEKILEEIQNKISEIKNKGINEEEFNRIKKKKYGDYVIEYNDVSTIARIFLSDYFKGINSFDYIEEYKNLGLEYANELFKQMFNTENMVISVVR